MFDPEDLTLRVERLKPQGDWSNGKGTLSFVFCKGGRGRYTSGRVIRQFAPGDVLGLAGASRGKLLVDGRDDLIFWHFSACLEQLFTLLVRNEIPFLQAVIDDYKDGRLYPAFTPLAKECHSLLDRAVPQSGLDHRSQVLRVVAVILSEELKRARAQGLRSFRPEEHMVEVLEKMSMDQILNQSVSELAEKCGCGRRHLNRLFHQHFGFSVGVLKMEMRLLKAVCLLRDPEAKVTRIAEACGFNHQGFFNICFKRRFGVSPGKYRKMNLAPSSNCEGVSGCDAIASLRSNREPSYIGKVELPPALEASILATPADQASTPARALASNVVAGLNAAAKQQRIAAESNRRGLSRSGNTL